MRRPSSTSGTVSISKTKTGMELTACLQHQALQFTDGGRHAVDASARDDGVADIQLDDLRNHRDRLHVVVIQAVTGVHRESNPGTVARRVLNAFQLTRLMFAVSVGICA